MRTAEMLFSRKEAQKAQELKALDRVLEDVFPNFELQFHFEPFVPFCG